MSAINFTLTETQTVAVCAATFFVHWNTNGLYVSAVNSADKWSTSVRIFCIFCIRHHGIIVDRTWAECVHIGAHNQYGRICNTRRILTKVKWGYIPFTITSSNGTSLKMKISNRSAVIELLQVHTSVIYDFYATYTGIIAISHVFH